MADSKSVIPRNYAAWLASHSAIQGANEVSRQIEVTAHTGTPVIVYVQPNGAGPGIISFQEFAEIVRRHDDPVSKRFAASMCEWAEFQAGERPASNSADRSR